MGLGTFNKMMIKKSGIDISNLFAYYKYDQNALDTISGHDGVPTYHTYVPAIMNNGIKFINNLNSRVVIPHHSDFNFVNENGDKPFSITGVIKYIETRNQMIVNKLMNNKREWYLLRVNNKLRLYLDGNGTGTVNISVETIIDLPTHSFIHIGATYNGSGNVSGMKLYINGIEQEITTTQNGNYEKMVANNSSVVFGIHGNFSFNINSTTTNDGFGFWHEEISPKKMLEIATKQLSGIDLI